MDLWLVAAIGLGCGLAATAAMVTVELPVWKRWGLRGVLEWHENQVLTSRILRLDEKQLHLTGIFALHFLNGALGGAGLAVGLQFIPGLASLPIVFTGATYGLILWILTLIPIHKPITGIHPWNHHPDGRGPAIASLAGHILYGIVLGTLFFLLAGPLR